MVRTRLLALAFIPTVIGCSGTDGTAPSVGKPSSFSHQSLSAVSTTVIVGVAGELTPTPPRIQVTVSPGGWPAAGVMVTFAFSDNRGSDYSTVTDASGYAVLEKFRLDSRPGQYNVVATVGGIGSATFTVYSIGGQLIATYDLRRIGGRTGPFTFGAAQYQLFDDGTYRFGIASTGVQNPYLAPTTVTAWNAPGSYIQRGPGVIEFYLDPATVPPSSFYASRNGLFATGTVTGDVMKVTYQDWVDYEDEEYSILR